MDKKEYLTNKFKKDFLQYCLLQKDSLSAKEIADKLYGIVDLNRFINQGKREITALIDKYLPFENLKINNSLSNELTSNLNYELKDRIITEFQNYLNSKSSVELVNSIISKIKRSIELQTWHNGITNMQEAITLFLSRINNASENYSRLYTIPVSEDEILNKFNKAKENTFIERIRGNNIDDIIEYRNVLIEYVRTVCENKLYTEFKKIYSKIVKDNIFEQLQAHFNYLSEYAEKIQNTIVDYQFNYDWDNEYNHIIPTDFYLRNVENITAEQAFHMILLQFFAQHESWMVENVMLVEGEICVYTQIDDGLVDKLLHTLCVNIFKDN